MTANTTVALFLSVCSQYMYTYVDCVSMILAKMCMGLIIPFGLVHVYTYMCNTVVVHSIMQKAQCVDSCI